MKIQQAKRIVIKIGSSLIIDDSGTQLKESWLKTLVTDINDLQKAGKEVIIVSSGAIALGYNRINKNRDKLKLEEKQAAAACGQTRLVKIYQELFSTYGKDAAQILLTIQDTEDRRRYLNAKNTIETLLNVGIIPIINENDTIATNEIRFGDNDRLAARVAQMVAADLLILLSDVDGLYDKNPRLYKEAKHIKKIEKITLEIENMAGAAITSIGSGGMITKVAAAKIAVGAGCDTIITKGNINNPLQHLQKTAKYTWFVSSDNPVTARKHWIAGSLNIKGEIIIDDGAAKALKSGKSLLPAGVIDIQGNFDRGDAVIIRDFRMNEIGKGLIAYSADDAKLIKGQQSSQIANITGFAGRNELIHRDNLALTGNIDNTQDTGT